MVAAPEFLRLAGHDVRWRLIEELSRGDRPVRELITLVEQPQSLVSYHLGQLRRAGLVTTKRSSFDAREFYYRLDLARCGELLAASGGALHPALRLVPPRAPVDPAGRVLFLCTGNSSRSQLAEALLRHLSGGKVEAFSAGSHPKTVHPDAVRVLAERDIDWSAAYAKPLERFLEVDFDLVVTLCDRVREVCPEFPGHPGPVHWSVVDPSLSEAALPAFRATADELTERIGFLLHRLPRRG